MLMALDFHLGPAKEVAVVGAGDAAGRVLASLRERYLPNIVVAAHDPAAGPTPEVIP